MRKSLLHKSRINRFALYSFTALLVVLALLIIVYYISEDRINPGLPFIPKEPPKEPNNLVLTNSFEGNASGWDLRPGAGADGGELGVIDTEVYHTAPASLKIPSSGKAVDTGECDRSVWQSYRIPVDKHRGQTLKLSGWVMHSECDSSSNSPCWVNQKFAGDKQLNNWDCCTIYGVCENPYHFQGPWCEITDRGGVRLGMDFREGETMFKEYLVIADWTTEDYTWHYLEIVTTVPEDYVPPGTTENFDADTVIVWIQGFECAAPGTVWVDDLSVTIEDS